MKSLIALLLTVPLCGAAGPTEKVSLRIPFLAFEGDAVKSQELKARVNGVAAVLSKLLSPQEPLVLIVVLDLAGDLSLVDPARQALIAEIAKLPPNVSIALMRAQDGLRVLDDPGTPRDKLAETIQTLSISGRAGLLDTVITATRLADALLQKSHVRTAVLFLSDSLITNYREDYTNPVVNSSDANDMSRRFPEGLVKEKLRQLKAEMLSTLTPFFLVHVNYQRDRLNEAYQTGLMDLAAATGGNAKFCRSVGEIPGALTEALDRLGRLQTVEVELKPGRAKQWDISLEAPGRQLQYRTHYTPAREKQ
jgi:hypothetical protein